MSDDSESNQRESFNAECNKIVAKHIFSVGGGTTRFTVSIDMKSPIQVERYEEPFYKATFTYYSTWMGDRRAPVEKCWHGYCTYVDITSESVHAYVVFSDPELQDEGKDENFRPESPITHTYDRVVMEILSYPRLRDVPPGTAMMEKYLTTMNSDDTFDSNGVVVIRDFFAPGEEIEEFCRQWVNGRELFITTE